MTSPTTPVTAEENKSLYTSNGVEKPTHTTSHNQVIIAAIPAPTGEVMQNYVQIKRERDCSWDVVASGVEGQDPVLAEYLRKHGAEFEKTMPAPGIAEVLIDRAVNPLTTEAERTAVAEGAPIGSTEAKRAAEEIEDKSAGTNGGAKK